MRNTKATSLMIHAYQKLGFFSIDSLWLQPRHKYLRK